MLLKRSIGISTVKQMGEDQLDDVELDGPITLRILNGTAWDFTSGGSRKFWWGGFEAKTSKIRMSSPKLRLIFRPKSEIQRRSPKKKKGLNQN